MSPKSRKRKVKRKRKPDKESVQSHVYLDYYQPIFYPLIQSIAQTGYSTKTPHPVRSSFWKLLPCDTYSSAHARQIVTQYGNRVEKELGTTISRHSIAYWLHLYRRLAPTPFGLEQDSATVLATRAILEAAIQKYGLSEQCSRIGFTHQTPEENILKGALMAPEFKFIRDELKKHPQLVLTDFGPEELIEFYQVEKLAFELWRCAATLRILGKGATLHIVNNPIAFYDDRSDALDKLVSIYDKRHSPMGMSATGTVFLQDFDKWPGSGGIFLPTYNVGTLSLDILNSFFRKFYGSNVAPGTLTNFIWMPFNLAGYFAAHKPFCESFEKTHGIPLSWIIGIIGALAYRVTYIWRELGFQGILKYWQRAYEGPYERAYVIREIENFLSAAVERFDLQIDPAQVNVLRGVHFLELAGNKREIIDVLLGGPHSVFLPLDDDRIFIDYAWILNILYNLFYGVKVSDQNFKGDALEQIIHKGRSVLPTGPCKAFNGENRQIDAAFEIDGTLLIIECRAVARSLGVDRGDPAAIQYRIDLLNRTLSDIDKKARWLARNPVGTNYDIRKYQSIMPIGVTPFVEYLPSLDSFYWIDTTPRVLTPEELKTGLEDGTLKEALMKSSNGVKIIRS